MQIFKPSKENQAAMVYIIYQKSLQILNWSTDELHKQTEKKTLTIQNHWKEKCHKPWEKMGEETEIVEKRSGKDKNNTPRPSSSHVTSLLLWNGKGHSFHYHFPCQNIPLIFGLDIRLEKKPSRSIYMVWHDISNSIT